MLLILDELAVTIQEGVDTHRLQLNPHLTLLEESLYHSRLKPLLVRWMMVRTVAWHPRLSAQDADHASQVEGMEFPFWLKL